MKRPPGLPDFENPPAVETLLGVYFSPLKGWITPYFGLFWHTIRKEYPKVQVQPPFVSEQGLRLELRSERSTLRLSGEIPVRWLYTHGSERRLIQIQTDCFIQNWRKRDERDSYLHYAQLRPSFEQMWKRFCRFLADVKVEAPIVQECEVTYINHIDRGRGWTNFGDLSKVVSGWSGVTSGSFLPTPTFVSLNAAYPMPGNGGRLSVSLQPGIRPDGKETLQLNVSGRCKPTSPTTGDLMKALDLARGWVVNGFTDLTTEQMHKIWKKKERRSERR